MLWCCYYSGLFRLPNLSLKISKMLLCISLLTELNIQRVLEMHLWVLATKNGVVCVFSTAAGGESYQVPSVFKQTKDKVAVSTRTSSVFFIWSCPWHWWQCFNNFRYDLDFSCLPLSVFWNPNDSRRHLGTFECPLGWHVVVAGEAELGFRLFFISKTKRGAAGWSGKKRGAPLLTFHRFKLNDYN